MLNPDRISRYRGTVIGQCLGDALGFVVEGYPPAVCADYVESFLRAGRAGSVGRRPIPFGQYTDDSQLMRELLQSFVACGGFDPADYASRVLALFVENRIVGRGRTTEAAVQKLSEGVRWDMAGTPAPASGNGSAMRAGAAGLIAPGGGERLVAVAHDQGRITHADLRCSAGAVAIAAAVAHGIRAEPLDPEIFCQDLAGLCGAFDPALAEHLRMLPAWSKLTPAQAYGQIGPLGSNPDYGDPWPGISPFVTTSVLWSLYSFLRAPADYWETICIAIAVGGDVDTTAAMAGAVSGAHLGLSAVPDSLARQLNDQGTWGFDELVRLADQVCELAA